MNEKMKTMERIRKLFALAGGNSSQSEALSAMNKARALMVSHGFNEAEIRQVESAYVTKGWQSSDSRRQTKTKKFFKSKELVAHVAALNNCIAFTNYNAGESCFFGQEHDVETCIFMMKLLQNAFVSSWKDYQRSYRPLLSDQSTTSQKTSFENGMLYRLLERLDKMIKERDVKISGSKYRTQSASSSPPTASEVHGKDYGDAENLAKERRREMDQAVTDAFDREFVMPKRRSKNFKSNDREAAMAGYEAGERVNICLAIMEGHTKQLDDPYLKGKNNES